MMTPEEMVKTSWTYRIMGLSDYEYIGHVEHEFSDFVAHRFMWLDMYEEMKYIDVNIGKDGKIIPHKTPFGEKYDFDFHSIAVKEMREMLDVLDKRKAAAGKAATA